MPTSLAQVLTNLLIYYRQGDRVAGVTFPWTREETPSAVSLLLLRPRWVLAAKHLQLGSGEGVLNGQGLTVQCGFRGYGQEGQKLLSKYFRQPLSSVWFFVSDLFDMVHFQSLYLICFNIASILYFEFLTARHVGLLSSPSSLCMPHNRPINQRQGAEARNMTLLGKPED